VIPKSVAIRRNGSEATKARSISPRWGCRQTEQARAMPLLCSWYCSSPMKFGDERCVGSYRTKVGPYSTRCGDRRRFLSPPCGAASATDLWLHFWSPTLDECMALRARYSSAAKRLSDLSTGTQTTTLLAIHFQRFRRTWASGVELRRTSGYPRDTRASS